MKLNKKHLSLWKNSSTSVVSLFQSVVNDYPNTIALIGSDKQYTYRQLDILTNKLAFIFKQYFAKSNPIVGLYIEQSYEFIVLALAILKAGGSYLYLDKNYPKSILVKIINETKPVLTVIDSYDNFIKNNKDDVGIVIHQKEMLEKVNYIHYDNQHSVFVIDQNSTAFIGYTSGTTGNPKGIKISHLSLVYSVSKFWEELTKIKENEINRFAYATYLAWDALSPLIVGATAFVPSKNIYYDMEKFAEYIFKHKINHIFFTPTLLTKLFDELDKSIIKEKLQSLKVIWLGGEVVSGNLLKQIKDTLPNVHIFNNYGPSECFVVSQGELTSKNFNDNIVNAGYILPEIYGLVFNGNKFKDNGVGELYVGGVCLADGYINNELLTKKKFITINNKKYYKTEDIVYISKNKQITILGRTQDFLSIEGKEINILEMQNKLIDKFNLNFCLIKINNNKNNHLNVNVSYTCKEKPNSKAFVQEILNFFKKIIPSNVKVFINLQYSSSINFNMTSKKVLK